MESRNSRKAKTYTSFNMSAEDMNNLTAVSANTRPMERPNAQD